MKRILLLITTAVGGLHCIAQSDPLRLKLDSIFQFVDKAQIPTGYLKEYGAELMPLYCFNRILTDSNAVADIDAFWATYTDISTARIQAALPAMTNATVVNMQISNFVNDAGGSPAIKSLVVNNCGSFFMASPNPSSGNVNISAIQPPGLTASVATTKIYQLKVVDQYGVVKKQYNYPAGVTTTNISLNDLVAGIYNLQAFDGTEWGNRQVVKQ